MTDVNDIRGALTAATDQVNTVEQYLAASNSALDETLGLVASVGGDIAPVVAGICEHAKQDIWIVIAHLRDATNAIAGYMAGL